MLVTDSGTVLRMCGRAVALVCILFLSASALVTRSSLPSPRARVCTFRCVRVRVGIGIQDVSPASSTRRSSCSSWPVASFPFPAYFPVFPLPFAFRSSLPSASLRSFLYRPRLFVVLDFFLQQHHVVVFCVPLRIMLCFHFCPRAWSPS